MDRRSVKDGLHLGEFGGLATNPPRGLQPAPIELVNVLHGHTGGYSPMPAASLQATGITRALSAGKGHNLFVQTSQATVGYFNPATTPAVTIIPGMGNNGMGNNAVPIMPDLALILGGASWLTPTAVDGYGRLPVIQNAFTLLPVTQTVVSWFLGEATPPEAPISTGTLTVGATYDFLLVFVPTATAPYNGVASFRVVPSSSTPTLYLSALTASDRAGADGNPNGRPAFNVYGRKNNGAWAYLGSNLDATDRIPLPYLSVWEDAGTLGAHNQTNAHPLARLDSEDVASYTVTAQTPATYHQGQVWFAPTGYRKWAFEGTTASPPGPAAPLPSTAQALPFNRVLYSEVISGTLDGARPTFFLDNYVDLPFRASTKVTGFLSAGRFLYILGDKEAFLLSGFDDTAYGGQNTFQLEPLGESIGCTAARSIQAIGGVGYYLSDSGVVAIQGANVVPVGNEVRDLTSALNLGTLTSTVDYGQEVYYLSDGTLTLAYSAAEKKWSTREVDGTGQQLSAGGGTAYSVHGDNLYTLSGEPDSSGQTPALLPMTVGWPPLELGDWTTRKTFRALLCGLDADGACRVESRTGVQDWTQDNDYTPDQAQDAVTVEAGVRPVRIGLNLGTGVAIAPRLIITPSAGTTRCVLRPPLQAMVGDVKEVPL